VRALRQIRNRLFATGLFFLQGFFLPAQHITLTIDKDTIAFNETVTLRLSGEAKDISSLAVLPQIDGLVVTSQTKNWSMTGTGGNVRVTQTYTLSPYKAGTFIIGPAWIQVGSTRIFSNKVQVVVKSSNRNTISSDIFMRCEPDKKKALLGEQITLSLVIYTRTTQLSGADRPLAKTFNGFWYKEGDAEKKYKDSVVLVNGLMYYRVPIYKEYVFPNTTGKLTIPAYEYSCFIKQTPFPTGDPMVDDVMAIEVPVELVSPEVPIEVSDLPEKNKPDGFAGDVGKFSLSASIDKENIKVNDAVKLTVTINGKGNINFIQLPKLKFPDGIESFPPVSNDSTTIGEDGIEGEKTFTITLIPKKEGKYILPGISFPYYDPAKKEYVTIQTPEFNLNVAPGDPVKDVSENNLPDSFLNGNDNGKIIPRILWIAVPALLLSLLLLYRSKKKKEDDQTDEAEKFTEESEELVAVPVKKKPDISSMLQVAEKLIINGNVQPGISQLYETLLAAILYKTELGREESSIHQLRYRLGSKNLDAGLINEIIGLLEELGVMRYSTREADRAKLFENLQKTQKLASNLIF
jgi:hypothetical protein